MARALVIVIAGVALGGIAAAVMHSGSSNLLPTASNNDSTQPVRDQERPGEVIAASGSFATYREAVEKAAGVADGLDFERQIEQTAAQAPSARRDAELDALLGQLAERDAHAAVDLAERLDLDVRHMSLAFKALAATSPDSALDELKTIPSAAKRRAVALSLLDVFGVDAAGTERIAASFPPVEARAFTIDAIAKRAEHDMAAAIDAAEAFRGWTSVALSRTADAAVRLNPELGLELSARIDSNLFRRRFRDRLLDEWAKLDPEAMLSYLEKADLSEMVLALYAFQAAAAASPERLLAIADRFGPAQRTNAQRAAVQELSALDPATAYERVRNLPPSGGVNTFIRDIAQRYAQQDPEAALAWAMSLEPRSSIASSAVLSVIAATDPVRAADAVIAEIVDPVAARRGEMPSLLSMVASPATRNSPQLAGIVDKIAMHPDSRVRAQLDSLISIWSQTDAKSAADWALRQADQLTPGMVMAVAQQLGNADAALATQSLARLPSRLRGTWVTGAAQGMAQSDLEAALAWVERFRGETFYATALETSLQNAAQSQPVAVARLIDAAPTERATLVPMVAASWAGQDPAAASSWLLGLRGLDEGLLGNAVNGLALQWAGRDESEATRWVLDLPQGGLRDSGLSALLRRSAASGTIDERLLRSFSSQEARASGLMSSLLMLGRSNPELGRSLIAQHISDPNQRAQAERQLQSGANLPAGIIFQ